MGSILQRHRAMRWLAPVGVLGAVAVAAGGMIAAKASPDPLPSASPAELVAGMQHPTVPGFSGTLVAQTSLGLPELPGLTTGSSSSMASLLAGSHTLRLWSGGADEQRVALLGATDETDVFRSGKDVWEWDSSTHTATHLTLPDGEPKPLLTPETPNTLTPQELASRALATIDKSTKVSVDGTRVVADRSAYVVVLTPRDSATRVSSVRISVDGKTKLPLAVQVFARGVAAPAIDVAFSDVSFRAQSPRSFRFTPPPGVTVREAGHSDASPGATSSAPSSSSAPSTSSVPSQRSVPTVPTAPSKAVVIGTGWGAVVEYHATAQQVQQLTKAMLRSLPKVSGAWGSGRLFDSSLFSALVTDDGRVFAGAVDPGALYAAAGTHK